MTDLHYQSLSQTCQQIKSGARTSRAVTEALLQRIDALDPVLKSYARIDAERALEQADHCDARQAEGAPLGALHGVPVAIKDLLFTEGEVTASGTLVMSDFRPDYTATVVHKLREAGAVIIGKTQLTEGAFGAHHPQIPAPRNPYDQSRWPGVSSSGTGVAVAAGLAFAGLGTDTGGSIRFPSASCGLVGIKPTYGLVSRYGAFPLAESLDHIGPMARNVLDAARVLGAITGPDENDPTSVSRQVPHYSGTDGEVRGLRLGIDWQYVEQGVADVVVQGVREAVAALEDEGVTVVDVSMPASAAKLVEGWALTCALECAAAHKPYYPSQADRYGPMLRALIDLGLTVDEASYQALQAMRGEFRQALQEQFADVDAMLMPTMPDLPQDAAALEQGIDDDQRAAMITFTAPYDYSGHPTITMPLGLEAGLPRSVQLVAGLFEEQTLISLGLALERHFPMPHPAL